MNLLLVLHHSRQVITILKFLNWSLVALDWRHVFLFGPLVDLDTWRAGHGVLGHCKPWSPFIINLHFNAHSLITHGNSEVRDVLTFAHWRLLKTSFSGAGCISGTYCHLIDVNWLAYDGRAWRKSRLTNGLGEAHWCEVSLVQFVCDAVLISDWFIMRFSSLCTRCSLFGCCKVSRCDWLSWSG